VAGRNDENSASSRQTTSKDRHSRPRMCSEQPVRDPTSHSPRNVDRSGQPRGARRRW